MEPTDRSVPVYVLSLEYLHASGEDFNLPGIFFSGPG